MNLGYCQSTIALYSPLDIPDARILTRFVGIARSLNVLLNKLYLQLIASRQIRFSCFLSLMLLYQNSGDRNSLSEAHSKVEKFIAKAFVSFGLNTRNLAVESLPAL